MAASVSCREILAYHNHRWCREFWFIGETGGYFTDNFSFPRDCFRGRSAILVSKKRLLAGFVVLVVVAGAAHADYGLTNLTTLSANADATRKAAVKKGWQGSLSLGYVATTGNTNTRSLNGQGLAAYKSGKWANLLSSKVLQASTNGVTTSESYDVNGQSEYSLTDTNYLFGMADYLRNTFAGYQRRTAEILGYGRRLLTTPTQQLDMELGAGARQTRFTDNTSRNKFVERLAASYLWKFAEKSNFSQSLGVEHGLDNTFVQSVTALTTNLAGDFALSVSYTVNHNTQPLPTFKSTDTITSVSLVYTF